MLIRSDSVTEMMIYGTRFGDGRYRMRCERCGMDRVCSHSEELHYCGVAISEIAIPRAVATVHDDGLPGTQLKKLMSLFGITASENCSCNARARIMDERGCDWCEQNIDAIVGWLREEAGKRGLPFLDAVGKLLVRRAISNARKEAERAEAQGESQPAV